MQTADTSTVTTTAITIPGGMPWVPEL
ncbi:hypothetical protein VQ056_13775 [Paenibacillus sp. JTLBN-2024]